MTRTVFASALRQLRELNVAAPSDAELLQRFSVDRNEDAFAEILRRHGPMVLGTSRSVLNCAQDAEDVFQATFLLLARKAGNLHKPEAVAGWLHGTARRLSLRRRDSNRTRQRHESQVPLPAASEDDLTWRELRLVLHEEIERLPEPLRIAVVLCYLEGLTQDEAAGRLGCPRGTLRSRLERGRTLLRTRLARRGLGPMAVLSAAVLPPLKCFALSPVLSALTLRTALAPATQSANAAVEVLVRDGLRLLAPARSWALTCLLAVCICCASYAVLAPGSSPPGVPPPEAPEPAARVRTDRHGDPLPQGAVARLGTLRLRQEAQFGNVAVSPDGKMVARGGKDSSITISDTATGKELFRLTGGHQFDCKRVLFLPDGKRLASCSGMAEVRIWDLATRKLAFIPEGARPLGAPRDPNWLPLLDLACAPDGKLLAGMATVRGISLWDAVTGKEVGVLPVPICRLERLRFLSDGRLVSFTRSNDGALGVQFWDTKTRKQQFEIPLTTARKPPGRGAGAVRPEPPQPEPRMFDVSADGSKIAGVGLGQMERVLDRWESTGVAILWDVATRKVSQRWKLPRPAMGLAFTKDDRGLAISQPDSILFFDSATGKQTRRVDGWRGSAGLRTTAGQVAFSADGKTLVTDAGMVLCVIDVASGKRRPLPGGHEGSVDAITYAPDGKTIATASAEDDTVRLWDSATSAETKTFMGDKSGLHSVVFSPDGKLVLAGGRTDTLRRWSAAEGRRLEDLPGRGGADKRAPDRIYFLATTANGKRLVTLVPTDPKGDNNPEVVVYELPGYRELARWEVHREARLYPAADGVLECENKRVILRDPDTGKPRWTFEPHVGVNEGMFGPCYLSPDGRVLATGFGITHGRWIVQQPRLRLWELASRSAFLEVKINGGLSCGAFSPDGRTFAAAVDDSTVASAGHGVPRSRFRDVVQAHDPRVPVPYILVWDLAQQKEQARFDPEAFVGALAFSPDGKHLATGLMDTTALIWDVSSARPRAAGKLAEAELERAWGEMASDNASQAQAALRRLVRSPDQAVAFLAGKVRPVPSVDAARVHDALARLDSKRFAARRAALQELKTYGDRVTPLLRDALKAKGISREKEQALDDVLASITAGTLVPERLRIVRSIQALELMGGAEARTLLELLSEGCASARETQEAKASLHRLPLPNP